MRQCIKYDLQKGIILVTVLIFLELLSMLELHALAEVLLAEKMNQVHWQSSPD